MAAVGWPPAAPAWARAAVPLAAPVGFAAVGFADVGFAGEPLRSGAKEAGAKEDGDEMLSDIGGPPGRRLRWHHYADER